MRRNLLIPTLIAIAAAEAVSADTVSFAVNIDTSSLSGTGGIYLSFSPGADSDPASVSVSSFTPSSVLLGAGEGGNSCNSPTPTYCVDGGVSGSLDANNLDFTNYTAQLNDYGEQLTLGSLLSFDVTFDLPDTFVGSSGSEFDIQMTQSDLLTPILTADPSGNIIEIPYDNTGDFSPVATSQYATVTELTSASTPEPGTGSLLTLACLGAAVLLIRQRGLITEPPARVQTRR